VTYFKNHRQLSVKGTTTDPTRIAVYRLEYNMDPPASRKRLLSGNTKPIEKEKKKRTWEFVDISLLYNVLRKVMDGFSTQSIRMTQSSPISSSHDMHHMKILACLIGFTGTDFTRSLPHLSPCKIWEALSVKTVWFGLLRAFNYEY
jgi:hypothetical protein